MRALVLLLLCLALPAFAQVPADAWQYRQALTRSAYRTFGPGAPIADLAAQNHVESGWRSNARSWAGAVGLSQVMPGTATALARQFPDDCAPANPLLPAWAFACRDHLMRQLVAGASTPIGTGPVQACSAWAFAFRGYNGGPGWMLRDRRQAFAAGADPNDWRAVRPFNAGRNAAAIRENREYPERIFRREAIYVAAGWGPGLHCLEGA